MQVLVNLCDCKMSVNEIIQGFTIIVNEKMLAKNNYEKAGK